MIDITEYHEELFQEIHGRADAEGRYAEDAFFDVITESLIDAGEIETADRVHYWSPRGVRVDGYGGDPVQEDGVLSLIIADFNQSQDIASLTLTNMDALFKRLTNFLVRSLDADYRNSLEESDTVFGLADLIAARWSNLSKVRMFLITNRVLSSRVDGRDSDQLDGVPITYSVWDLGRLHRFNTSGQGREDYTVDLREFGGPLIVLAAHMHDAGYESYLTVFPGRQLALIYDRWGARLLEQNVRVFLQARGKVNRGLRNTIATNPEMFFAYNNGVTATAESVEIEESPDGKLLTRMRNFQIVNGGQTTASIHAALRNNELDLNPIFVQMKISIVEADVATEVVPKISEYANTQNRVSAADFFSNHPFHVRMEAFSRRLFVPSKEGTFRQSKWFYERARGQYQDARGRLTRAAKRRFDLEYPKSQMFTKTDLAKFQNVWRHKPEFVSRGAQKNFSDFASHVGREWSKRPNTFNEMYYRETIAKAIVFRSTERLVSEQPWYQGGYRANVVAYAIAKLSFDVSENEESINFEKVWQKQELPIALKEALTVGSKAVHDVIVEPPLGMRNVTEWAKQQACWNRVMRLNVIWPTSLADEFVSLSERQEDMRSAAKEQRVLNGVEAQIAVVEAGSAVWSDVKDWGNSKGLLSSSDQMILDVAISMPAKLPSEKQCIRLTRVYDRLKQEGCVIDIDGLRHR